jgi:hypothetical protein
MSIPGLEFLNSKPWTRPALGVLTAIAMLVQQVAPAHTKAHQIAGWALSLLAPLVAASVGKSYDAKDADAEVAARGGPAGVLKGLK